MSLLEVKNLKKVYTTRFSNQQVQALSNVSLVLKKESMLRLWVNQKWKTTLLNILASLINQQAEKFY